MHCKRGTRDAIRCPRNEAKSKNEAKSNVFNVLTTENRLLVKSIPDTAATERLLESTFICVSNEGEEGEERDSGIEGE